MNLDDAAHRSWFSEPEGRRSALGKLGVGLLAVTTRIWQDVDVAAAACGSGSSGAGCCDVCCDLASSRQCNYSGLKCNFNCTSCGGRKKVWYCMYGTNTVACGECTTGSNCFQPSWTCSIYWFVGSTC